MLEILLHVVVTVVLHGLFVGDELFWGQDRLSFVEEALMAVPA